MNEARKAEIEQKLNSSREDLILDLGRTTTKSALRLFNSQNVPSLDDLLPTIVSE